VTGEAQLTARCRCPRRHGVRLIERVSTLAAITALPLALWELSLGVWLIAKGFNPSAIASLATTTSHLVAEPLVP